MSNPCTGVLWQLAEMICALECFHKGDVYPVRVAIDGVDGAGKTTLADKLARLIEKRDRPVIRASVDSFHNPREVRYQRGADSPEGYYRDSFDYGLLKQNLLIPLGPGGNRIYRQAAFNIHDHAPILESWREAPANAVLLFDGVFLLRPELIQYWEISVFVEVDFSISVPRAVLRDLSDSDRKWDMDSRMLHYERRYVPGQQFYLSEAKPREQASIIVDNNDYRNPNIIKCPSGN